MFVEVRKMLKSPVATIQTGSVLDPIMNGLASATLMKEKVRRMEVSKAKKQAKDYLCPNLPLHGRSSAPLGQF